MKILKEYENTKKEFIKLENLNSDNIYDYLGNETVLLLIRRYYEVYTKFLFNQLMGSLRLEVSKEKAKKLVELKGEGSWEFAGMVDMYERGAATCELGHPLRYVYKAINVNNGQVLNFGSRCVGDFFDLDPKGIKALTRVKDEMFAELKDMAAILKKDLFDEHYKYDCEELGIVIKTMGKDGVKKLKDLNPLMPIVYDFVSLGLPLPKSLLNQVLRFKDEIDKKLSDPIFLDINYVGLNELRNSEISLISHMFTNSYYDIVENIKKGKIINESDFYNFRNVNDLNIAISHWLNRNERLLKAQDYFKKQGISLPWIDIYKSLMEQRLYRDNPRIYYGLETLLVFDKNIMVESNMLMPKDYGYKGYQLSPRAHEDFDGLINYLATREFLMAVKGVYEKVNAEKVAQDKEEEELKDMMSYLMENLEDEKYSVIKGIMGVRDIILKKKLSCDRMSEKQLSYVKGVYNLMQDFDKSEVKSENVSSVDEEVNKRYTLQERPEILAKIQRLQREVQDLPNFVDKILATVMRTKFVSDKQIVQIDKAFSKYILNEEVPENIENSQIMKSSQGNKKWSLIERPDIKEKIVAIRSHGEYTNIPDNIKNIFANILKYNMVSEKQIDVVENTYKRHFGGR